MDRVWPRLLRRPTNIVRLVALLGFALLAGLALVVSLTTRIYTGQAFSQRTASGWADIRALVTNQRTQLPPELQTAQRLALAAMYPLSDTVVLEHPPGLNGEDGGPARDLDIEALATRPAVMAVVAPEATTRLPQFLVGTDAPTAPLQPGQAWVTRAWAEQHNVKKGDTISVSLLREAGWPPITLAVAGVGEPLTYLFIGEDIFAHPRPGSLPPPAPQDPLLLLASVGPAQYAEVAEAIRFQLKPPRWPTSRTSSIIRNSVSDDEEKFLGPYQITRLLSRAASGYMALLACFAVACSLWLAASLSLQGQHLAPTRSARLMLSAQSVLLYWGATSLGVLLGGYGPNMLSWETLGMDATHIVASDLMVRAEVVLALLAPPALPAIIWLRSGERINMLRQSAWGNQLRAGLVGSVALVTALGLAIYAAGWWQTQSLLFYNILAAMATGVIGGVGPLAVLWNGDQNYRSAARSAGAALFVCLLMAFTFCTIGALLIFWTLWPLRELPVLTALSMTLAGIVLGYVGAIILGVLLALTAGTVSGILVVAFGRKVSAGDRETLAENAVRIEGLLLMSRLVLPILLSRFISPASDSRSLETALGLYLITVLVLLVLLRFRPQRVLLWSAIATLVDGAAISTLVAVDGGWQSPFYLLYFVALLTVAMRFGSLACLGAILDYAILYLTALFSAEGLAAINADQEMQRAILNRLLLLVSAGVLASLLAGERQRALRRLDAANKQLLADEVLRHELAIARQIQQNLFPRQLPLLPGVRMAASCLPARETGGDLFDVLTVGEDQLALIVGDVSGKSIPAAIVMAMARSAFRAEVLAGCHPAEALSKANQTLQGAGRGIFIAVQYALINREQRSLVLGNAGQLAPMLRRGHSVTLLQLTQPALPLGISPDGNYGEQCYELQAGDVLLFYTDGVVEAMNSRRELYGFERLEELLRRSTGIGPEKLVERVIADITAFAGDSEQHDDITLVAVEIR